MESSPLTQVVLPVALGVIMLGLGLSLTLADFRRVVLYPRAVMIGLTCQMLLLPGVAFAVAKLFELPPELAVGLMLLAASPGGATANLFSHLAKGDVALNVTLTAINSVLALFTLPLIVNSSMAHFFGEGASIGLQFSKVVQVFGIVLGPVSVGMLLRARRPGWAARLERPVKALSIGFLVLVVAGAVMKERANLVSFARQVGLAALTFNLASMAVGYGVPRLARLGRKQAISIGMEIGIHNATLAIAIASSPLMLGNSRMAIAPAVYSLIMFVTAAIFGWVVSRGEPTDEPPAA